MQADLDNKTVGDLLDLRVADMLYANREYQRGAVWSTMQKKLLVDSVLRGYPIPLIYLHFISKEVAGHRTDKSRLLTDNSASTPFMNIVKEVSSYLILRSRPTPMRLSSQTSFNNSRVHGAVNDSMNSSLNYRTRC